MRPCGAGLAVATGLEKETLCSTGILMASMMSRWDGAAWPRPFSFGLLHVDGEEDEGLGFHEIAGGVAGEHLAAGEVELLDRRAGG